MPMVSVEVPNEMIEFVRSSSEDELHKLNVMILYSYMQHGVILRERAAVTLGDFKMDMITLYRIAKWEMVQLILYFRR